MLSGIQSPLVAGGGRWLLVTFVALNTDSEAGDNYDVMVQVLIPLRDILTVSSNYGVAVNFCHQLHELCSFIQLYQGASPNYEC